jgi:hypothetical protein
MSGVEVNGLNELITDFRQLGKSLEAIPTMIEISKAYVSVAERLAPRREGHLARSIKPSTGKNSAGAVATAPYASWVNYGAPARNMKPTYFMNKADKILQDKVLALVEKGVDQLIDERGLG